MKPFIALSLVSLILSSLNSCKDTPPGPCTDCPPETTIHAIDWETISLGDGISSSVLSDVAIINDTLVYAVGEIYMAGATDLYNLARWDGTAWHLQRVTVQFRGNTIIPPLDGITAFSSHEIWLVGSLPIYGDGTSWQMFDLRATVEPSLSLSKAWGTASQNIFLVGRNGSIAHHDGTSWTKIESGTGVDLLDVWGSPDGSAVWACGYKDFVGTVLVRLTKNSATPVYASTEIAPTIRQDSIPDVLMSLWTDQGDRVFLSSPSGIYRAPTTTNGEAQRIWPEPSYLPGFPRVLRGQASNDVFVGGDLGFVAHYNGASWHTYAGLPTRFSARGIALSSRLIVTVGPDHDTDRAMILMGRR